MDLLYVDSCVLIYALEEDPCFGIAARRGLADAVARNQALAISPLVQLECLVGPLARQQSELLLRYQNWLRHFHWLGINDTTFSMATELRARHGLKTPDALHLATALQHGCRALISNDKRFERAEADLESIALRTTA
ncbi:MAG: type II toxin-antitoxin system VapC family toxin [Synechococcaceae cyanobacterium]